MLKLCITIFLTASLLILGREIFVTWENNLLLPASNAQTKRSAKRFFKPGGSNTSRRLIQFYPKVPSSLPDLSKGYIFNKKRSLGEGKGPIKSQNVDLDDVIYTGSIITSPSRIALISVHEEADIKRRLRRPKKGKQTKNKHMRLSAGDTFGSYNVAEVLPDKIIFSKGGEKFEKLLYDPTKQRIILSPQRNTPSRSKNVRKRGTNRTNKSFSRPNRRKTTNNRRSNISRFPPVSSGMRRMQSR